jgi:hypothetical protein
MAGGASLPQAYSDHPLGVFAVGIGLGNARRNIGLQVNGNIIHRDFFTFDAKVHKDLGLGSFLALGARNFYQIGYRNDFSNYYAVFSHEFRHNFAPTHFMSRIAFRLGAGFGTGISKKMPKDIIRGYDEPGTGVFGALQYRLTKHLRVETEWTGINLNTFLSYINQWRNTPFGINIGLADLTPYSSDRAILIVNFGTGFRFN